MGRLEFKDSGTQDGMEEGNCQGCRRIKSDLTEWGD